jgi:ribosome biogenesis GTPase
MPVGTVIRLDTASCLVLCEGQTVRCPLPGKWRLSRGSQTRRVAVGDRLELTLQPTGQGAIEGIRPRQGGKLSRNAPGQRDAEQVVAANLDQLIVVVATAEPPLNRRLLDRLIVSGEHGDLAVVVCVNKIDLAAATPIEPLLDLYRGLGYQAIATSATTAAGIDALRQALKDRTSVFAGPSGAGKSSLLMAVQPGLELRVATVSSATSKGRHTTTAVSLLPLRFGGCVVDTPGIREFGLYDLERDELKHYFPEMERLFGTCNFADCSHRHEPGCAVLAALEAGRIDPGRYDSYCRIYDSLPEPDPSRRKR